MSPYSTGKDALLETAMALHDAAMKDEYFIKRKLAPNVDFWYVLCAHSAMQRSLTTCRHAGGKPSRRTYVHARAHPDEPRIFPAVSSIAPWVSRPFAFAALAGGVYRHRPREAKSLRLVVAAPWVERPLTPVAHRLPVGLLPGAVRGAARGRVARALAADDVAGRGREDLASETGACLSLLCTVLLHATHGPACVVTRVSPRLGAGRCHVREGGVEPRAGC